MSESFTEAELEAYLEESLDNEKAAQIEKALRNNRDLLEKLATINSRRDSGVHSIGEIWRRHQLSVPTREELGGYLLGILSPEQIEYIRFRLEVLKCPYTIANLKDLEEASQGEAPEVQSRRTKFLNSTSRYLSNRDSQS
jgi:hypothetical protein